MFIPMSVAILSTNASGTAQIFCQLEGTHLDIVSVQSSLKTMFMSWELMISAVLTLIN